LVTGGMMMKKIIVWDLGATKCAAGIVEYDQSTQQFNCVKQFTIKLAETLSLQHLIESIEIGLHMHMQTADAICIGGAGHYDGRELLLTNGYPYRMLFAEAALKANWPIYHVVHDYTPIVCATFTSYMNNATNLRMLNDAEFQPLGRRVALGIGTGLGLKDGVLLPSGDFWIGQNEVGHIGVATPPFADRDHLLMHAEIMEFMHRNYGKGPITFEKILSGQGTHRLYQFFYPNEAEASTPEMVGVKMRAGETPELDAAFAWYAGLFVGTVQLIFMPQGGIWITGGVALSHLEVFDHPNFFAGIHASPAYRAQREEYPLGILMNQEHAMMGGAFYAINRLLSKQNQVAA